MAALHPLLAVALFTWPLWLVPLALVAWRIRCNRKKWRSRR